MNLQIPIVARPLTKGNSRLAPILNGAYRTALCEHLLRRILALGTATAGTATAGTATAPTTVVTADPRVVAIARSTGSHALRSNLLIAD